MIFLFSCIFSDRYANQKAVGNNILLLFMYRLAHPVAYTLNTLGLRPNHITVISIIAALVAALALVHRGNEWLFCFFWSLSLLMDFCDGTVARMSNLKPKSAFRFDHNSDLVKISMLMIAVGWREEETIIWLLVCSALFCFLYYSTVSEELRIARMRIPEFTNKNSPEKLDVGSMNGPKFFLRIIYEVTLTINGHTLLIFLLFPLGFNYVIIALVYLISVCCFGALNRIRILLSLPRGDNR